MTKVIFLNGPPRSGKDTIAAFLQKKLKSKTLKFADPLKKACHALFGLDVSNEYYDSMKDEEIKAFLKNTPRSVYTSMSEDYAKDQFGQTFFSKILLRSIQEIYPKQSLYVISDSGFIEESTHIAEAVGKENCLMIHLYRDGCDFNKDSRSYIHIPKMDFVVLMNTGTPEYLQTKALSIVSSWLEEKK